MMDCLLSGMSYTFDVPDNTPSGELTVFWAWVNKIGNREYYMECADILINTGNNHVDVELKGKELLVVNLPGYPVIPEFVQLDAYNGSDLFEQRKDVIIMPATSSAMQISVESVSIVSSSPSVSLSIPVPIPAAPSSVVQLSK